MEGLGTAMVSVFPMKKKKKKEKFLESTLNIDFSNHQPSAAMQEVVRGGE